MGGFSGAGAQCSPLSRRRACLATSPSSSLLAAIGTGMSSLFSPTPTTSPCVLLRLFFSSSQKDTTFTSCACLNAMLMALEIFARRNSTLPVLLLRFQPPSRASLKSWATRNCRMDFTRKGIMDY